MGGILTDVLATLNRTNSPGTQELPQPVYIRPYRAIDGVQADAVIEEIHEDDLVITDLPVEVGSTITDHAYNLPCELSVTYAWGLGSITNEGEDPNFLNDTYELMLQIKAARSLVTVYTGKRKYQNMLLKSISETTDERTENVLVLRISLREVILANTQTINFSDKEDQAFPEKTAPVIPQGQKQLKPSNVTIGALQQ